MYSVGDFFSVNDECKNTHSLHQKYCFSLIYLYSCKYDLFAIKNWKGLFYINLIYEYIKFWNLCNLLNMLRLKLYYNLKSRQLNLFLGLIQNSNANSILFYCFKHLNLVSFQYSVFNP